MRKFLFIVLLCFFINGLFVAVVNPVLAPSDLVENSWNTKTSMSQARSNLGVVAVEGKIYAIGGTIFHNSHNTESVVVGTNERYDPTSDTWITLESMPAPRRDFAIVAYQNKIYCIGGETNPLHSDPCDMVEVYDIATNSWSTKASIPFNGGDLQANVVDGKIFVTTFAGNAGFANDMKQLKDGLPLVKKNCLRLFMYDPTANSWTEKTGVTTNLAMSNCGHVSTVLNDKILIVSSTWHTVLEYRSADSPNPVFTGIIESNVLVYDPKLDVWNKINSIPEEIVVYDYGIGITSGIDTPQRIYLIQGQKTYIYDPAKDTWATGKSMSTERSFFGVATVNNILYVIGGSIMKPAENYTGPVLIVQESVSINEQYIPGIGTLISSPNQPNPSDLETSTTPTDTDTVNPDLPKISAYIIATIIVIIIAGAVGSLVLFQKRKKT